MSVGDRVSVRFEADATAFNATLKTTTSSMQGFVTTLGQVKATAAGGLVGGKDPLGGLGAAMSSAETKVTSFGSKLRGLGSAIGSQATSFGVATASIWGAYNAYDSLIKVELRAETASNRVKTMTTTLATLQERHTEALQKHNLTATEMAILEERITNTKAKLATAQAREADLQGDVNEAWAGFASQIGPQVVAAGASIVQLVTNLNASFPKTGGLINTLKNAFVGLIPQMRFAKAESLLLGQSVNGAGLSFGKIKGVVPEVERSVAGLASGLGPLTMGFGKAEKGAESFGGTLGALKGKLGLALSGLAGAGGAVLLADLGAKMQANMDKISHVDSSKRQGLLNAIWDPEQAKIQMDSIKEFDQLAMKADVTGFDHIWDAITGSHRVQDKAKAAGQLDSTGKLIQQVEVLNTTAKKAAPTMNELATSGSGWVNALIKADTPKKMEAFNAMFKASGKSQEEYKQIVLESTKVLAQHGVATADAAKRNHFMQTSYAGLTGETAKYVSSLRPLPPTYKGLTGETAKYVQKLDDAKNKTEDFSAAMLDQQKEVSGNTQTYLELKKGVEGYMEVGNANMDQLTNWTKLIDDNVKKSQKQKQAIQDESEFWAKMKDSVFQSTLADNKWIIAHTNVTQILDGSKKSVLAFSEAQKQGVIAAQEWFTSMVLGTVKTETMTQNIANSAKTLGIQGDMMSFSNSKAQELIGTTYAMNRAFSDQAEAASTDVTWLQSKVLIDAQLKAGAIAGGQAANDWTAEMIKSTAAAKAGHGQLVQLAADMLQLPVNSALSTEELHTLMQTFQETEDAAGSMAEVMTQRLIPAFETIQGLLSAKSGKDFSSAFKDIELPKDFGKGFKDALKDMSKDAKTAREGVNAFDVVVDTAGRHIDSSAKEMKKFGKAMDDLTKLKGTTAEVDKLIKSLKGMTPEEMDKHTGSMHFLKEQYQQFGELKDPARFIKMFNDESTNISPSVDPGTESTNKLGAAFQAMGLTGVAARAQVDMVTGGVDVMNQAFEKSNPVIKVNPKPGLDAIAKATNTFGIWFDMAQRSNPAMKANPSAALTAINKVSTTFGIVFHMIQTSNPAMKVNNSNALNGIKAVQSAIDNLPKEKSTTLTVNHVDTFKTVHLRHGGSFISQPGFQHGGSFIASQAQNFKGAEIAEFNKPELVTVTPLTNPNDITDRTIRIQADHVDRFQKPRSSGPIHVHIDSPIYLYPNGEMVGRMQRKYVLDNIGKYPNVQ